MSKKPFDVSNEILETINKITKTSESHVPGDDILYKNAEYVAKNSADFDSKHDVVNIDDESKEIKETNIKVSKLDSKHRTLAQRLLRSKKSDEVLLLDILGDDLYIADRNAATRAIRADHAIKITESNSFSKINFNSHHRKLTDDQLEFITFIETNYRLYRSLLFPMMKMLQRKVDSDKYNSSLAPKTFEKLISDALKQYERETKTRLVFSRKEKDEIALYFALQFEAEVGVGNRFESVEDTYFAKKLMESGEFGDEIHQDKFKKHNSSDSQLPDELDDYNSEMMGESSMPLKGHRYHNLSDAELLHIARDAKKAADSIKGNASRKYLDQVNDAMTVLNYRKRGGKRLKENEESPLDMSKEGDDEDTPIQKQAKQIQHSGETQLGESNFKAGDLITYNHKGKEFKSKVIKVVGDFVHYKDTKYNTIVATHRNDKNMKKIKESPEFGDEIHQDKFKKHNSSDSQLPDELDDYNSEMMGEENKEEVKENYASREPNSAIGQRREPEMPKHIDVIIDTSRYGKGYRVLVSFPNSKPKMYPPAGQESASSKEELVLSLPTEYLSSCMKKIELAFSTAKDQNKNFQSSDKNAKDEKVPNVVVGKKS